jgi:penicillin-binding protein 2
MKAVTAEGGTASFLFTNFPANISVASKTGTAQTGRVGDISLSEFHGVFIAFAPADDPKIAFAGVIEYGQHGSESAGYVAKDVFEQYFGLVDHYAAIVAAEEKTKRDLSNKPAWRLMTQIINRITAILRRENKKTLKSQTDGE